MKKKRPLDEFEKDTKCILQAARSKVDGYREELINAPSFLDIKIVLKKYKETKEFIEHTENEWKLFGEFLFGEEK